MNGLFWVMLGLTHILAFVSGWYAHRDAVAPLPSDHDSACHLEGE